MSKRKPFIIISQARSGSTVLNNIIRSLNNVNCLGEVLGGDTIFQKHHQVESFMEGTRAGRTGRHLGFKLLVGHWLYEHNPLYGRLDELLEYLPKDTTVISLIRRNSIKIALSARLAMRSNEWVHHADDKDKLITEPVRVPMGAIYHIEEMKKMVRDFKNHFEGNHLHFVYEEDLMDVESQLQVARKCAKMFGVFQPNKLEDPRVIRTPQGRPWKELISNLDELLPELQKTPRFMQMLEED